MLQYLHLNIHRINDIHHLVYLVYNFYMLHIRSCLSRFAYRPTSILVLWLHALNFSMQRANLKGILYKYDSNTNSVVTSLPNTHLLLSLSIALHSCWNWFKILCLNSVLNLLIAIFDCSFQICPNPFLYRVSRTNEIHFRLYKSLSFNLYITAYTVF